MDMAKVTLPRPSERIAVVSFLLVFCCGVFAGALAMNFVAQQRTPKQMSISLQEWKQLDLTQEQTRQLMSILDDFSHYYDNLLADGNTRVLRILTPEQRRKFDKFKQRKQSGFAQP
jgi:Spy/CpxP family protein refolding chaperone